jgi:serine protease Do
VIYRWRLALIATLMLSFGQQGGHARAAGPVEPPTSAESEFASMEEARAVQKQLRSLSDNVAPALVKLTEGRRDIDERFQLQGSGVVIHPSGLILTHGHHGHPQGTVFKATFSNGQVVDAVIDSVISGRGRDFSLLKIRKAGQYPAVPLRQEKPPSAGERCFHFGYPSALNVVTKLSTPALRLGRIAGAGQFSSYANCLIVSGDSGGPLFDFDGRLIGILDESIGPQLRHPGAWANVSQILDGTTFLTNYDNQEVVRLGFTNAKREAVDTRRDLANKLCSEVLGPARRATVEVLLDGQSIILGTVVDTHGHVLTKRSEIMTHRGILFGKLTCRLSDGDQVNARAVGDSREDDVALLQLSKRGLTSAPFSRPAEPLRGVIVMVPIPGKDASETGVVSLDGAFKIESRKGRLTVPVDGRKGGVTIASAVRQRDVADLVKLMRGSISEGDVITHIEGEAIPDPAAYVRQSKNDAFVAGDFVQLSIRRNRATSQVIFPIESDNPGDSITSPSYVDVSMRLTGLPAVIIHDAIVGRRQCGGPIVDLEGNVVGVNIARFHRCSTFAIPHQRIKQLVQRLLSKPQL